MAVLTLRDGKVIRINRPSNKQINRLIRIGIISLKNDFKKIRGGGANAKS